MASILCSASAFTALPEVYTANAYGSLRTPWAEKVCHEMPWPEYPRPQLIRENNWVNLNGRWDFAVTAVGGARPASWQGKILVPFAIESQLSGVQRLVNEKEELWYHRTFEAPAGERVLLHFGAVDWRTTVWVNGGEVGNHEGGYTPFTFDITDALARSGEQELVVRVWDPTDTEPQPRGKQVRQPAGIYYTPITGIWQTVWLEGVPRASVLNVQPQADIEAGVVRVTVNGRGTSADATVRVVALDGDRKIGVGEGRLGTPIEVAVPEAKLWAPGSPHLYDLEVSLSDGGDTVRSYFALREISFGRDEYGFQRMLLNGEPLFQYGLLDQGFWPDGLYTAPTDEALRWDIVQTLEMGFNMARKHVKVESARWYRHADELGLLVWQDMPNGSSHPSQNARSGSGRDGVMPEEWSRNFRHELREMIDALRFFPSVIVWIPFNEGWGQHDTNPILQWAAAHDPSRLIGGPSGWEDMGWGHLKDMHAYPGPRMFPVMDDRVSVLGEFGGLGLAMEGHLWQEDRNWGYQSFGSSDDLMRRYSRLIDDLRPLIERGLAAAVYTQTTDVEIEVNGLITYDRRRIKIDPAVLRELHRPLYQPHPPMREVPVVPTAETEAQEWDYVTKRPDEGWERPGFDPVGWKRGPAGFGTAGTPGAIVGTVWEGEEIWLRRSFDLPEMDYEELYIRLHHDEDAVVYLNGEKVFEGVGYRTNYRSFPGAAGRLGQALRPGKNVVAIHCRDTGGGQFIDFGLVKRVPEITPAETAEADSAARSGTGQNGARELFANPIAEGADPWVVEHDGLFYWCFSEGNRGISIWVSDRLTSLGVRNVVWEAPPNTPYSREVWAPELHFLDGRWYVYFAASDGNNHNHLAYALESAGADPLGPYTLHGPFATGDGEDGLSPNIWAIDMTILEHGGERYAIWSGWDAPGTDQQYLYIGPMSDPLTLSGPRVRMAANDDYLWERTEERPGSRGLGEAPQVLQRQGRTFVTYSCGASWLQTYKLGLLELTGPDPLDPDSWTKHPEPVFQSSQATVGVGHSWFLPSPDRSEWWHVFHAKVDQAPGWRRAVFIQPFAFRADGFPDFGTPLAAGELHPVPSGQVSPPGPSLPLHKPLHGVGGLAGFSYYGHQQLAAAEKDGLHLGDVSRAQINVYRSGEKFVLDGLDLADLEASVNLRMHSGDRDAGLLFRVRYPALGFDAQKGYFAGIIPGAQRLILGRMDGDKWEELGRADAELARDEDYLLTVRARGDQLTVLVDGREMLSIQDDTYSSGSIGVRVVNTHARFRDLKIKALE